MPASQATTSLSADEAMAVLNARQRKFVVEYLSCLNASEAARRAGHSLKTAYAIGAENLRKPQIIQAISLLGEQMGMSAGEATRRMSRWAAGSMEPFLDDAGNLILDSEEARQHRHLIKKVKQKKTVSILLDGTLSTEYWTELELHDAKDATDKILHLHGRYVQKVETTQKGTHSVRRDDETGDVIIESLG